MPEANSYLDRQRGAILGAAVEFKPPGSFNPVTNYRGGGPHGLGPGEFTDDTSMALALADSITAVGWDLNDQARRYVQWWREGKYSVNGTCFDIVIILCDHLSAQVLGCYGGPVPTPNIDRIAHEGVLFRNTSCTFPVCSPSRATLATGLYPHSHGITYNVMRRDYPMVPSSATQEGLKAADVTTESILYRAGYATHF